MAAGSIALLEEKEFARSRRVRQGEHYGAPIWTRLVPEKVESQQIGICLLCAPCDPLDLLEPVMRNPPCEPKCMAMQLRSVPPKPCHHTKERFQVMSDLRCELLTMTIADVVKRSLRAVPFHHNTVTDKLNFKKEMDHSRAALVLAIDATLANSKSLAVRIALPKSAQSLSVRQSRHQRALKHGPKSDQDLRCAQADR